MINLYMQEEYKNEGIEWININYFNNEIICKMMEASPGGMIPILDEECIRPGEDDDRRVLMHMNKKLADHPHYGSNATGVKELQREVEFKVCICVNCDKGWISFSFYTKLFPCIYAHYFFRIYIYRLNGCQQFQAFKN